MSFAPFVLTAELKTPIVLTRPLHLDGLLLASEFRADPSRLSDLSKILATKFNVAQASASILITGDFGVSQQPIDRVRSLKLTNREADAIYAAPGASGDKTTIGQMSPMRTRLTRYQALAGVNAIAWQAVGDAKLTLDIAKRINFLGSMNGQGFGEVYEWQVQACHADINEAGWRSGNHLIRRLPVNIVNAEFKNPPLGAVLNHGRITPPYWFENEAIDVFEPLLSAMTLTETAAKERLQLT